MKPNTVALQTGRPEDVISELNAIMANENFVGLALLVVCKDGTTRIMNTSSIPEMQIITFDEEGTRTLFSNLSPTNLAVLAVEMTYAAGAALEAEHEE